MSEPATNPHPSAREPLSWGGKLGAASGTAWRLLRGRPGRNKRLLSGVQAGASAFARPLRHVLGILFLEASGVVFLVIALSLGTASLHEYRRFQMHEEDWQRAALAGVLGVMFFYFAVSSFWRARKKR
jgi:hypothetical protein